MDDGGFFWGTRTANDLDMAVVVVSDVLGREKGRCREIFLMDPAAEAVIDAGTVSSTESSFSALSLARLSSLSQGGCLRQQMLQTASGGVESSISRGRGPLASNPGACSPNRPASPPPFQGLPGAARLCAGDTRAACACAGTLGTPTCARPGFVSCSIQRSGLLTALDPVTTVVASRPASISSHHSAINLAPYERPPQGSLLSLPLLCDLSPSILIRPFDFTVLTIRASPLYFLFLGGFRTLSPPPPPRESTDRCQLNAWVASDAGLTSATDPTTTT